MSYPNYPGLRIVRFRFACRPGVFISIVSLVRYRRDGRTLVFFLSVTAAITRSVFFALVARDGIVSDPPEIRRIPDDHQCPADLLCRYSRALDGGDPEQGGVKPRCQLIGLLLLHDYGITNAKCMRRYSIFFSL